LDRAAAEDLVLGGPQAWRSDPRRVAGLLAAAAAPPAADELAGEEGAAMAFRAVARHRASARRGRPARPTRAARRVRAAIARAITIKVAVLATGALGAVGLVYAVGAGNNTDASPFGGENTVHSAAPPPAHKAIVPSTHASPSAPPTSGSGSGPSQRALCREYAQQDRRGRNRMLDDPSFAGLRESAGVSGADRDRNRARMDDYCTHMLSRDSGDRSGGDTGTHTGSPDDGHSNDRDPYDPH
jgi:hypothetical protein